MSNRNPEDDHSSLPTVLRFALEQWTKGLHTAFPGMVLGFDPSTKRARIQPAIRILMTDGSEALRAPLADVPIIWPSAGGLALTFPIPQGASVMVLCSERGLTDFKRRFAEASPDPESVLDLKDAVAFAGFGALSITKAGVGATLQTEDGRAYIEVDHGMIRVKFGAQDIVIDTAGIRGTVDGTVTLESTGKATLTAPEVEVNGALVVKGNLSVEGASSEVKHKDTNIGSDHTHILSPGPPPVFTGPPRPPLP